MMKKAYFIGLFFLLMLTIKGTSQPLIGQHAKQVEQYISTRLRDFVPDRSTKNTAYHYLKYVDQLGFRTLLVFLSDEDTCTYYKIVYDNNLYNKVIQSLNSCCKPENDHSWIEEIGDRKYRKSVKRETWFFTVTTRPLRPVPEEKK